jgi:hypothetical protein
MKSCDLCGTGCEHALCRDCIAKMDEGLHPIVCTGCADLFGELIAVTWFDRKQLEPETTKALDDMEQRLSGYGTFITTECKSCKEFNNVNARKDSDPPPAGDQRIAAMWLGHARGGLLPSN